MTDEAWTIQRVLAWAAPDFKKRGHPSPRLDAELLLGHALGASRVELITDAARPLSPEELASYRQLHARRRRGEPVAYLLGVREFYGHRFQVDERVLVPRPETELLVDIALELSRPIHLSARILDLCTGSGCVAISIAKELPTAEVVGADASAEALVVARDNALRLKALPTVSFRHGDLFAPVGPDAFDLVVGNPPYIASADMTELPADIRDFEPRMALEAGPDGLSVVRRIVEQAPARIAPGGWLALEIGAGQAGAVQDLYRASGFDAIEARRDYAGIERVVLGRRG